MRVLAKVPPRYTAADILDAPALLKQASPPKPGDTMPDGSVFAGLTPEGKHQIFAMPTDLNVTMSFNDAAKRVAEFNTDNARGHDDWQIPDLDTLRVLYKNENEGALKGTFNTNGNKGEWYVCPGLYWSSTEHRDNSSYVHDVRFSDGSEDWNHKDILRLSCRPVRLVEASAPAPAPR